jgi:tripartite-type tricarboxylate transporter receptor subunit TctC
MRRRQILVAGAAVPALLAAPAVRGQGSAWPNRPIRLIVPYPAGVSPDVVARIIAERLGTVLGQQVMVDNRAGAGGLLGTEVAAAAPNDGHSLLFCVKAPLAIAPHLQANIRFRPLEDFAAITQLLIVPHVLTAAPNTPYANLAELVAHARRSPGRVDYASLGVGSQPHVAMEAWAKRLDIRLNHVPYRANPQPDVMNGTVSLSLEASTTAVPAIQGGRIKALAISGTERIASLPAVPTVSEHDPALDPGGVIGNSWHGIFAPIGTPEPILARLNLEVVRIVNQAAVQERLRGLGLSPTGTPAATLAEGLASDHAFWGALIRELGIRLE